MYVEYECDSCHEVYNEMAWFSLMPTVPNNGVCRDSRYCKCGGEVFPRIRKKATPLLSDEERYDIIKQLRAIGPEVDARQNRVRSVEQLTIALLEKQVKGLKHARDRWREHARKARADRDRDAAETNNKPKT